MKKIFLLSFLLICALCTFSRHIKGGFFNYRYLGPGTINTSYLKYKVTLTVYMDCDATGAQIDPTVNFTIFNGTSATQVDNILVLQTSSYLLQKIFDDPCITGDQAICYYRIVTYELASVELSASANGYTISYQRCCRIENMDNIANSGTVGNTYTIKIPGTASPVPDAIKNSSPEFPVNDTAVICENSFFRYPFSASDPDKDSLSYSFCNSYSGGTATEPAPVIADAPPYNTVPYFASYSGSNPLGTKVTINPITGLISGIAPPITNTGEYAVTVCVSEYRKGVYIGETRKELHIRVRDCSATKAFLNPIPTSCDGFNVNFSNNATNPSGTNYFWDFGEPASGLNNTSLNPTPTHTYLDTGIYLLKLRVDIGGLCADSTTTQVKVYPGFFPGFKSNAPLCKGFPVQFTDTTKAKFGAVTGWHWDFGNLATTADTSIKNNPSYVYPDSGTYQVRLIVGSTFGCIDTVQSTIQIRNTPAISIVPRDTLICFIDTLQIKTTNTGTFVWSPNYNINNVNSANPLVSPDVPTTYFLTFTDPTGCTGRDSVFVDVVRSVNINVGNDTTICRTDGMIIGTNSNALHYTWTPSTYLSSDTAKHPFANPLVPSITYHVVGNVGKCSSADDITIRTLPYPPAKAGNDTTVCYGRTVQLKASGGIGYQWSPATFLNATNIANPIAVNPTTTTQYIVAVTDITGCPKPAFDTVIVNVDPLVVANAGPPDTTSVLGEPLIFNATGGIAYEWTPSTWLSNTNTANPVALPEDNITYYLKVSSEAGCTDTDSIRVKLFKVPPSFYVPTGFTPNNDQNNDVLKPILLGMRTLNYFRVYNRWGKLMFSTSQKGQGWDGTFKGNPQDPGTYVWMAEGATFQNNVIKRKGYVVLLR
ncbi:MAG: PKD domain-containing protein [Ferruginibacter sp.]